MVAGHAEEDQERNKVAVLRVVQLQVAILIQKHQCNGSCGDWLFIFYHFLFYTLTAWETTIESAVSGSQMTYVVTCDGPCTQLTASILTSSGDADLYANEEEPPSLDTSFECWACSMCEAYTGDLDDICPDMATQNGNR